MPIQIDLIDELKKSVPVATPIKAPSPTKIKKRHWLLSSMVILVGSWITHTTTATISSTPAVTAAPTAFRSAHWVNP